MFEELNTDGSDVTRLRSYNLLVEKLLQFDRLPLRIVRCGAHFKATGVRLPSRSPDEK